MILVALVGVAVLAVGGYALIGLTSTTGPRIVGEITMEDAASLADIFRVRGMTVVLSRTVEQPFFTVNAQVITVEGEDIQVFEYDSSSSVQADVATVTPEGQFTTTSVLWVATPHFYRTATTIILYVGDNVSITDVLEDVAGPQFAGG